MSEKFLRATIRTYSTARKRRQLYQEMRPKSNPKIVQACKAMKGLGYSEKTVMPIVKELVKLYEDNWMLIEDDSYRVLVEAILDSEELKTRGNESKRPNTWSEVDAVVNEPHVKKPRLNSQENQSSPSFNASIPNFSNDKDIELKAPQSRVVVKQEPEYKLISDDENDEYNSLVPFVDMENHGDESDLRRDFSKTGNQYDDLLALSYELPSFEVPLAVSPPDSPVLLLQESSYENCSKAKESRSIYPEVIYLDSDDEEDTLPHDLFVKDDDFMEKKCDLKQNHSEITNYKNSEAEEIACDVQDSLKLDIASSSRGDAKISLTINASLGSCFRVPSLEAVLKQVEDRCLKSYEIPQARFSLLGLMKEVCDCFLAAGTTLANTENLGPTDEISYLDISEEPVSDIGPSEVNDDKLIPFKTRNLFEVSPQIQRFSGLVKLDLTRRLIYLNLEIKELNNGAPSSSEIVIFQKKRCYHHYIKDITKGHEPLEISLVNEVNEDKCPAFNYISKIVTYKDARVEFPLARITKRDCCSNCFGDCLSLDIRCACAEKNGCEFAYTAEGLVKENFLNDFIFRSRSVSCNDRFYCRDCPLEHFVNGSSFGKCKGHANRKFIKECWYKCGCSMNCGNRVVQRGITAKLQVFMAPEGKGWGLRTMEDVPKGAFICEYVGEVVTVEELFERNVHNGRGDRTYNVVLDAGWSSEGVLKDKDTLCLDATVYGNIARFINHRCFDANLVGIPVEVETPDHHYYHLAFFTTRNVDALEEITWDYGIEFDECQAAKAFRCRCGSKFCRDPESMKS